MEIPGPSPAEEARNIRTKMSDSMEVTRVASFEHAEELREMRRQAEILEARSSAEHLLMDKIEAKGEIAVFGRRTLGTAEFSAEVTQSRYVDSLVAPYGPAVMLPRFLELAGAKELISPDLASVDPNTDLNDSLGELAQQLGVDIRKYRWSGADGDISMSWEAGVIAHADGNVESYEPEDSIK